MLDMKQFEEKVNKALYDKLLSENLIDARFPENLDVEGKWASIGESYLADGIREFPNYPMVSLGWMMYIGMAVAKFWDEDWAVFDHIDDLYRYMRDKRGYDALDDFIRETVLQLKDAQFDEVEKVVRACAECAYTMLHREEVEPGTEDAFRAYVACLHQLYLMGSAVQLRRMGYRMVKM